MTSPELTAVLWEDHEARIRVLERRHRLATALISAVTSVVCTLLAGLLAGCYPGVQHPTPDEVTSAHASTVRITVGNGWNEGYASGGFVTPSLVLTAGHVCDDGNYYTGETPGGTFFVMTKVLDQDTTPGDLCLLRTVLYRSPTWFGLAPRQPAFGERVWYVGYPWTGPAVYVGSAGEVIGEDEKLLDGVEGLYYHAIEGYPGSSGSPLLDESGRVVGVMSRYNPDFTAQTFWVGVDEIALFFKIGN